MSELAGAATGGGKCAATLLVHAGAVAIVGAVAALPFGIALGRAASLLLAAPFAVRMLSRPPAVWLRAE